MTTPADAIDIGEVVRRAGVPVSTLHVWERHGIVAPVGLAGLRRQYGPDVLDRIAIVVVAQRSGFTLQEIATVLDPRAGVDGRALLSRKLQQLRERQRELDTAIAGLEHALECQYRVPLECPHFRSSLADVLPVRRQ